MILYAKIRRMYFRDQLSINEIVRRTSLSRNTVKKWLKMPTGIEPAYQRRSMPTKLTPYEEQLKQALIADSYRPKRDRRTSLKLLEELQGRLRRWLYAISRRRIWQDTGQHCFASFAELNEWLENRCQTLWAQSPCPDTGGLMRQEALDA
jgi:transposase